MNNRTIRIGSRGSELALWQARWVQTALRTQMPESDLPIDVIRTTGDRILDSRLSTIGEKDLFTKEIEESLLDNRIDLAVHSLKDLPTELPSGLAIGAVCRREDVRDVFIPHPANPRRSLRDQQNGATIATGSLRRTCQLLRVRPDFRIVDIRGNLNTRVRKLGESDWAGMILARAGVVRLGWDQIIGETIDSDVLLPAVGQGALAIEIREGDAITAERIAFLNDERTARETSAERALLRRLEGGCQVPIGAYARHETGKGGEPVLRMEAMIGSIDGRIVVRGNAHGLPSEAVRVGQNLAETLLRGGGDRILEDIRAVHVPHEPA
jgi:hydroxymethylbilane synthase